MQNKKYTANKKNGGNVPPLNDIRTALVPVGCGNCIECSKKRKNEWKTRLLEEIKHNTEKGYFITLTFSNESYKKLYNIVTTEIETQKQTLKTRLRPKRMVVCG